MKFELIQCFTRKLFDYSSIVIVSDFLTYLSWDEYNFVIKQNSDNRIMLTYKC